MTRRLIIDRIVVCINCVVSVAGGNDSQAYN